uniref:Secreted protein n=1 Tax=Anopheles minimus TaxID=112268 RepID=A0A182WLU4_9DIPT
MASGWKHPRLVCCSFVLAVLCYCATFQGSCAVADPFFYPSSQYYYNTEAWKRPAANGYSYYQQPTAAESQNVAVYGGNPNYYGVPGYEDHRSVGSRNSWNDPNLRWKWNNYYNGYYYPYPSGSGGWNNRNDATMYYNNKRRQDSAQPPDTTPQTTTTTQRPRKKKLFVPNVWG